MANVKKNQEADEAAAYAKHVDEVLSAPAKPAEAPKATAKPGPQPVGTRYRGKDLKEVLKGEHGQFEVKRPDGAYTVMVRVGGAVEFVPPQPAERVAPNDTEWEVKKVNDQA